MNPQTVIETYVGDVVRHLPRRQRNDVAFELRSLLGEELQGRAADTGREADLAMTTELLADFGLPADVADRYRPAGFTIVRPSDAPRFAQVALGGVVVQWVITLVATYSAPVDPGAPGTDWLSRLGTWWLSWGLGSFWWPGFLISLTIVAAAIGARREAGGREVASRRPSPAALDRDRINRPVTVLTMALALAGASLVVALPSLASWGGGLPAPVLAAFEFDADFLAWRAPWVLVLWAATLAVAVAVLVAGRWARLTRRISIGLDVAWLALLAWWVAAGPIFVSEFADEITKGGLLLVAAFTVLDLVLNVRRLTAPIQAPAV